jgi:hypothetical protein
VAYLYERKEFTKESMKNILAENLLRFGVKNLSESSRKKLIEQATQEPTGSAATSAPTAAPTDPAAPPPAPTTPATNVKLTGAHSQALLTVPGISVSPEKDNPNRSYLQFDGLLQKMYDYLGGMNSKGSGLIGKTILFFKQQLYKLDPKSGNADPNWNPGSGAYPLENNNTDAIVVGSFIPKAWYVGQNPAYPVYEKGDYKSGETYLYLFNREITTNYSGDPEKPFIMKDGSSSEFNGGNDNDDTTSKTADLYVPWLASNAGNADRALTSIGDNSVITYSLRVSNKLKPGVDYVRVRLLDGYCLDNKGWADYLVAVNPQIGTMEGVTKIK